MKKRIGAMGGTFDPIHYGHLALAEHVRCEYHLDEIIFIPAGVPPHKNNLKISDNMHRYMMTELATIQNPNFQVSDIEVRLPEVSYTYFTLQNLKNVYGKEVDIYFITGADALLDIETWKKCDELLKMCDFIAGTRPGLENKKLEEKVTLLRKKYNAMIHLAYIPALDISSTDIRERVSSNKSIKYLVPEGVEQYIYKNELYK